MWSAFDGHERVVFGHDTITGMRAVIALHSTALGPGLGGTRMLPYSSESAAIDDALRLSRAMTYKNALAGIPHGGGKGVIWADPQIKTPELLRAYGRLVASQGGAYITACDVGTYVADMDVIAEVNPWTTGRSQDRGGAGDSGILTAFGVWQGMRGAAMHHWGDPHLAGRTIGIVGLGKVGRRLAGHLHGEGATVVAVEPNPDAVELATSEVPGLRVLNSLDELHAMSLDVYSPNALGGAVTEELARSLDAAVICGGANNQLATTEAGAQLAARAVTYAPDFMVNCGGVVQVAYEYAGTTAGTGFDFDAAKAHVARVYETTQAVLARAKEAGITPEAAAEAEAEELVNTARYA